MWRSVFRPLVVSQGLSPTSSESSGSVRSVSCSGLSSALEHENCKLPLYQTLPNLGIVPWSFVGKREDVTHFILLVWLLPEGINFFRAKLLLAAILVDHWS